jgi:hypothetical protein
VKVHYENVIHDRIANYTASDTLVPWWEVLNYGTVINGAAGYPNVPGLHFVEDAERLVPATLSKYVRIFEDVLLDTFDRPLSGDFIAAIERRAKEYVPRTAYIPADDLARVLTFGVPF